MFDKIESICSEVIKKLKKRYDLRLPKEEEESISKSISKMNEFLREAKRLKREV